MAKPAALKILKAMVRIVQLALFINRHGINREITTTKIVFQAY